jgi:hypothetical protein
MPDDPTRRWWRAEVNRTVECVIRKADKSEDVLQWASFRAEKKDWKKVEDDGCWIGPVLTYEELKARFPMQRETDWREALLTHDERARFAASETALKRMGQAFDKLLNATAWMCEEDEAEVRAILDEVSDLWPEPEAS